MSGKGRFGRHGSFSRTSKRSLTYVVSLSERAQRDLTRIYRQIDADDSNTALKWYLGLKPALLNLEELPNRCPVTPENKKLRHLLYGNKPHIYRAIYRVVELRNYRGLHSNDEGTWPLALLVTAPWAGVRNFKPEPK